MQTELCVLIYTSGCEHPVERLSLHVDQHVGSSRHGYSAWCASLQRGICSGGGSSMEQGSVGTAAQSAVGVCVSVWRSKVESSLSSQSSRLSKRKRGGADKFPKGKEVGRGAALISYLGREGACKESKINAAVKHKPLR